MRVLVFGRLRSPREGLYPPHSFLAEGGRVIRKRREGELIHTSEGALSKEAVQDFRNWLGRIEIFSLPPILDDFEQTAGAPSGTAILCERYYSGELKRVQRNIAESLPALRLYQVVSELNGTRIRLISMPDEVHD